MSHANAAMLQSWDRTKQEQYRHKNPEKALAFHFILDMSPSMHLHEPELIGAYNMYLAWLQAHANPMTTVELVLFSTPIHGRSTCALGECKPLTKSTYAPLEGTGTALYAALGQTLETSPQAGQHVFVVFTDGGDNASDERGWSRGQVFTLVKTFQQTTGALFVYLGAFPRALEQGKSMGFTEGNCLTFPSDKIPEAFQRLLQATEKYLTAGAPERQLLATGGVF